MNQSINDAIQTLTSNTDNIKFANTDIRSRSATCNGWLQHSDGSAEFNILSGGTYKINFSANISSATAGAIALALKANGNVIESTEVDSVIATANDYQNVSFTKIVRTCPRMTASLTVGSVATISGGSTATQIPSIKNANILIERIA